MFLNANGDKATRYKKIVRNEQENEWLYQGRPILWTEYIWENFDWVAIKKCACRALRIQTRLSNLFEQNSFGDDGISDLVIVRNVGNWSKPKKNTKESVVENVDVAEVLLQTQCMQSTHDGMICMNIDSKMLLYINDDLMNIILVTIAG